MYEIPYDLTLDKIWLLFAVKIYPLQYHQLIIYLLYINCFGTHIALCYGKCKHNQTKERNMKNFRLTEIPEVLFPLVNDKSRSVKMHCSAGTIEKINIMRGVYRIYIKTDIPRSSGEYRWTHEQATGIMVSIY